MQYRSSHNYWRTARQRRLICPIDVHAGYVRVGFDHELAMKPRGGYRGIDVGVESCSIPELDHPFVPYTADAYRPAGPMRIAVVAYHGPPERDHRVALI
ncbi:hypothetical protein pBCA079 (plasmid) [Burkholderia cenocepacia J2315]|uniref:Uncharacterized protein n=1 Tax=Burkholderia cenocepacia (strain ATCC BAA-245 / DSM 16553 / LMG 16656 / NCTC 13227 / J2315 / CF5610) TaxID=216591 RepID=B4EQL7_BURCJ|nr:hypothetical protein pBCA079 [Burkholderia cenocepacia J2315]